MCALVLFASWPQPHRHLCRYAPGAHPVCGGGRCGEPQGGSSHGWHSPGCAPAEPGLWVGGDTILMRDVFAVVPCDFAGCFCMRPAPEMAGMLLLALCSFVDCRTRQQLCLLYYVLPNLSFVFSPQSPYSKGHIHPALNMNRFTPNHAVAKHTPVHAPAPVFL